MRKNFKCLLTIFLFVIFFVLTSCDDQKVKVKLIIDDVEQEIIIDLNSTLTDELIPNTECSIRNVYSDENFNNLYQGDQITEDIVLYVRQHQAKEDWKRDSSQHWHACEGCDEMLDAAVHEYGAWVVDTEPDHANSVDGKRHRDCKVCGFSMKEAIKAKPVVWIRGTVNNWGNDGLTDAWKLTIDGDNEVITGVELKVGDEFKIADGSWGTQFNASKLDDNAKQYFGGSDNIVVNVAGTYTITIVNVLGDAKISVVKQPN